MVGVKNRTCVDSVGMLHKSINIVSVNPCHLLHYIHWSANLSYLPLLITILEAKDKKKMQKKKQLSVEIRETVMGLSIDQLKI